MPYEPIIKDESTEMLYDAILKLENVEECYRFFEDLCTINEIKAITQRYHVAQLLDQGITYHEIVEKTGASTATISRVNRCLHYGAGGYMAMLKRTSGNEGEE